MTNGRPDAVDCADCDGLGQIAGACSPLRCETCNGLGVVAPTVVKPVIVSPPVEWSPYRVVGR